MKVHFMLTCLCDAFYGEVGIAAVKVLESAGCQVQFNPNQTCCGQPPFNAGDWSAARQIADRFLSEFPDEENPIVTPSGSCAAMLNDGFPLLFPGRKLPKCFEVGQFLVDHLNIRSWDFGKSLPPKKVAFHRACHGRALGLTNQQELLLGSVPGVELVSFDQAEQCCGFGGAFSATHGKLSSGIGLEKLENVLESGAEVLASGDMGCLMHLQGLVDRNGLKLELRHYLEILAEALPD